MPLAGDEELLRDFAIRSCEHLDDADARLLTLESDPGNSDDVDAVFRAFHTIKGMAGFLALDDISEHAHRSESLLARFRGSGETIDPATVQGLFEAVDKMRRLVATATGFEMRATGTWAEEKTAEESGARPNDRANSRAGTVRLEEGRLDALLDTIGELVIAESMVSASVRTAADTRAWEAQLERLDKITRELQQMATSLRMVTLQATFGRMARLVRDQARKAGKDVDFSISGEDTELDKTVVDRIQDPLIHALRNAIDHGIEDEASRKAAGKPAKARLELRAFHAGGAIHIEVSDDGRGLDHERILARARELGVFDPDEQPNTESLLECVFSPGFSTATEVTDVSGRGVGMDVVKRTVEELRGRVSLDSRPRHGTTLAIRLPVTLAIIDGMVCRVGAERYVIPILSIERSVRPEPSEINTVVSKGMMLDTDNGFIPVLELHRFFGVDDAVADPTEAVIVVINEGGVRAGLLVCELLGQQQTVIKPLGEGLPDQAGVTGGAIMPDGRVGLIIDAAGLVRLSNASSGAA